MKELEIYWEKYFDFLSDSSREQLVNIIKESGELTEKTFRPNTSESKKKWCRKYQMARFIKRREKELTSFFVEACWNTIGRYLNGELDAFEKFEKLLS